MKMPNQSKEDQHFADWPTGAGAAPRTPTGRELSHRMKTGQDGGTPHGGEIDDFVVAIEAEAATSPAVGLDPERLTDIIEQAIFETDTGLEAALLATERILAALGESGTSETPR